MLESDHDVALVEREDQLAHEMGVTGVPAMIFGNKVAVSGAREPEMLRDGDRLKRAGNGAGARAELAGATAEGLSCVGDDPVAAVFLAR